VIFKRGEKKKITQR